MKKTLQECKEIVAKDNGWYDWNQIVVFNTEIELLTDLANKMYYEQSEWISVEDRVPEINDTVIGYRPTAMTLGDDKITILNYDGYLKKDDNGIEHRFSRSHHVTHWQSLPNPPQK